MKKVTKTMVTMLAVLCAACSLVAADQQSATEDIAAFEAGLQAIASKPKLMSAKLLSATSGTTVYPASGSDMNVTGRKGVPLDLYFNVTMASVSSATLYLNAYDVDYPSATERDDVYFNGTYIGRLQGYNGREDMNTFDVPARLIKTGSNKVHIDVDVDTSGNWVTQMRDGTKLVLNGEEGTVTLTVSKDLLNKIELNWSANYSGAAPYNIYRGKTSDNLTIYREGLTVTSFTDTDIVPGDTYYYQIKTMGGVSSTIEEAKSVKGVVTVIASQDLYHKVQLSWTTENCTGPFTIYRGANEVDVLNNQMRTTVATDVNSFSYADKVSGGQNYYYIVVSSNGSESNPVKGTSLFAEVKLEATKDRYDFVRLDWSCPVDGLRYRVFKSAMETGPFFITYPSIDKSMAKWVSFRDSDVQQGAIWYYYVESELGVKSNVVLGKRTMKEIAPDYTFELEGSDYPQSRGAIGLNNEQDILVAGHRFVCSVNMHHLSPNCTIKSLELIGRPKGGNGKRKEHVIKCKVDGSAAWEKAWWWWKDYQEGLLTYAGSDRIVFSAILNQGRGYHGEYVWTLKCYYAYTEENSPRDTSLTGLIKPVYFDRDGKDGKHPNWFTYWKDDGACPGLRDKRVEYRGKKMAGKICGGAYSSRTGKIYIDGNAHEGPTFCRKVNGTQFGYREDGRPIYGIYRVEDIVAHESQHAATHLRYVEQRNAKPPKPDSDLIEGGCGFDASAACGKCSEITVDKHFLCDSIVDEDEEYGFNTENGVHVTGLQKDNLDTFGIYVKDLSYASYGDNEFLSLCAGLEGSKSACWQNDWAYPGEQSGGLPYGDSRKAYMKNTMAVSTIKSPMLASAEDEHSEADLQIEVLRVRADVACVEECVKAIEYQLDLEISGLGPVYFEGDIIDVNKNKVATAIAMADKDDTTAILSFDAKEIHQNGGVGPYTLGEVNVFAGNYDPDNKIATMSEFYVDAIDVSRDVLDHGNAYVLWSEEEECDETGLEIAIFTEVNKAGSYELVGELSDTNGNYVARARVSQAMAVGTNEVSLTFVGAEIYNSAQDGPYVLSSAQLWSDDEMIDAATDLLTTEVAYSYEDFKPADTVVTVDRESAAFAAPAVLSDGALGALTFSFDVNNATEDSLCYRLSAALDGATGETVAMQNGKYVYLEPGVNHIEVTFSASAIAEKGIDGPYMMGLIELVHQDDLGNDLSFRPTVATEAYKASDFAAAAVAFSNEPSAKGVLECDTPTVVLPFEAKRVCTVVASATLIGTNGEFIARASATNRCDAAGVQAAEIVFPREALVAAGQQGPFSVGYFALLPLVDGEEPIYSDTFEVTGVEWIDWEGMFDWAFEGGTAQAALYKGTNGVVRVPSFVKGRDVISVGPCCFLDCECVAEIILPVGIAEVGIGAFFGTSLSAVELPESVATVGNAAFNVEDLELVVFDGPPPMSAPDAYPKGAVGTYSAAYAATWEAELKGGCLWNGLTMVPEGADADGYRTESGWTVIGPEDAAACEGKRTFRSAETADGASSAMTMDVEEQTSVSFWWKTSCEGARMDDCQGDHAEFLIDGVVVERIAGESCWKQVVVNISDPGQHELSWRYVKDGAGASGADCVWVSDVGFATAAGEMTHAELLAEADYNWFYENGPVECGGETPFEYIPEKPLPERTLAQIDILCDLGIRSVVDTEDAEVSDSVQTDFCRCANGEGLDFAVWTADGWMRVGNALVGAQQGEVRVTICFDYSVTPSQFACKVNNHTLTNENGQSSFVCAKQDCRVNEIATDRDGAGRIVAWAGRYDASNSEILEIAEGTEAECDSDLSNLPRETFQVSGGGTLVIKGADVPATGVKARLHVDQNSALRFDYSGFSSLPSVLTLFSGVGNDFMLGGNVSIVVPGEGTDRLSKLFVKDGNLEAHIAERPEIVTEGGSESPFAVDGENGSACLNVGNAVEGFWYGLLTTGVLTSDFVLDPDSVKQCTGTGSLRLESSVNANSDSGFYRVSLSAEKP